MNILITGGNGYIANAIKKHFSLKYTITSISRNDFDLRNTYQTQQWFDTKYYDIVIHTAVRGGNRLVEEDCSILHDNLIMFTNLKQCSDHYNKFITFGSGAELLSPLSYYGYSKKIINEVMQQYSNFFNLRIYAVFDENEGERRFIKSNLLRYITKQDMIIHKDKLMDFIYMPDLISIIQKYIVEDNLAKTIDCVYNTKYSLLDIANIINNLDNHKVNIIISDATKDKEYIGQSDISNLDLIGLEAGIINTYQQLKNRDKNGLYMQKISE